ncbi:NAD-dependent epimerase/dehydratase family protein [Leptospira wolffii]|uniref:NAD-dependent epimerase/dehydratase family protein n=1 Tax=Leptospira wolffii TaxID=409998 RepID=UPI0010844DB8|nr:NAD-dependent epimerase/dehydratase family protein [Leptospira wolffii]TGK56252.1 NAD-dependent epimerase/dehydratase family protein [Leptospira wolffii]TGK72299.1 NAD-dependent epimerase/dehydratase family protein [Leptospira wolffii]TGK74983.1 NAD-dependent epimerase/dehydratase family protein [Leptospira wolffii]TGL27876.1 NAD-dependent epimerase/dehydratase family protein [Leptospira wolffii]
MKIFVTGASGFVGGAIARHLQKKHQVKVLSRTEKTDASLRSQGLETVRGDLSSIRSEDLKGTEIIIHCAAFVGPWGTRKDFWDGNVEGTSHLISAAKEAGVKRFIHMGTEAALFYGQDMIDIDESYPYPKHTPYLYSETKAEAERRVVAANSPGFETIVLRPRLVWGPGDTSVLPVVKKMVQEGKFLWIDGGRARTSVTCIPNLVHATELALTKGKAGQIYFITDDEVQTVRSFLTAMLGTQGLILPTKSVPGFIASALAYLVEGIWRILGILKEPPMMRFPIDIMGRECTIRIDKAKSELGYLPQVSVAQGLDLMRSSK